MCTVIIGLEKNTSIQAEPINVQGWQGMEKVDFKKKTIAARAFWPSLLENDPSNSELKILNTHILIILYLSYIERSNEIKSTVKEDQS